MLDTKTTGNIAKISKTNNKSVIEYSASYTNKKPNLLDNKKNVHN